KTVEKDRKTKVVAYPDKSKNAPLKDLVRSAPTKFGDDGPDIPDPQRVLDNLNESLEIILLPRIQPVEGEECLTIVGLTLVPKQLFSVLRRGQLPPGQLPKPSPLQEELGRLRKNYDSRRWLSEIRNLRSNSCSDDSVGYSPSDVAKLKILFKS